LTLARRAAYPPRPRRAAGGGSREPPSEEAAIAAPRYTSRRLSYAALLVAAGLTGVYAESIPNFEVLTLVVFCSGVLLGARDGMLVGALSMGAYTLLNPYGPAHPLVMAAQIAGTAAAGLGGALFRRAGLPARPAGVRAVALALAALVLTVWFDLVTNLATGVVMGQVRASLIAGIPFSLWHIGYNVLLFVALGTALVAVFARYAERLA
jgi:hypothetical protein